ncbi:transglycosylase family protein [Streptomyces sp. NPDC050523]|uniref:transglycosylase family protein n=1 Tax=Streptomyces sp. NPDC050523 TaxID=3365622 RepID=UPI0037933D11
MASCELARSVVSRSLTSTHARLEKAHGLPPTATASSATSQISQQTWEDYSDTAYAQPRDLAGRNEQIAVAETSVADLGPEAWPHCADQASLSNDDASPGPSDSLPPALPSGTPRRRRATTGAKQVAGPRPRATPPPRPPTTAPPGPPRVRPRRPAPLPARRPTAGADTPSRCRTPTAPGPARTRRRPGARMPPRAETAWGAHRAAYAHRRRRPLRSPRRGHTVHHRGRTRRGRRLVGPVREEYASPRSTAGSRLTTGQPGRCRTRRHPRCRRPSDGHAFRAVPATPRRGDDEANVLLRPQRT